MMNLMGQTAAGADPNNQSILSALTGDSQASSLGNNNQAYSQLFSQMPPGVQTAAAGGMMGSGPNVSGGTGMMQTTPPKGGMPGAVSPPVMGGAQTGGPMPVTGSIQPGMGGGGITGGPMPVTGSTSSMGGMMPGMPAGVSQPTAGGNPWGAGR